jgi:hypothetical protein
MSGGHWQYDPNDTFVSSVDHTTGKLTEIGPAGTAEFHNACAKAIRLGVEVLERQPIAPIRSITKRNLGLRNRPGSAAHRSTSITMVLTPRFSPFCAGAIAIVALLCSLAPLFFLVGCGGSNSSNLAPQPVTNPAPEPVTNPTPQAVTVIVSSSSSSVLLGNTQQFTATVTGTSNTAVSWSVNGISGGNSTVGTISSTGLYTAPQVLPDPATVTIQATRQANKTVSRS